MDEINSKEIRLSEGAMVLRPYWGSDTGQVYEAIHESINELLPWMYWCHPDFSIDETSTWIESCAEKWKNGTEYNFAITEAGSGVFLGSCSLTMIYREHGLAEIGYYVRTSQTKQGIATAAVKLVAQFGFRQLRLNRIEIVIMEDNKASQRVAAKVGAIHEGLLKNRLVVQNKAHDAFLFSLINEDLNSCIQSSKD